MKWLKYWREYPYLPWVIRTERVEHRLERKAYVEYECCVRWQEFAVNRWGGTRWTARWNAICGMFYYRFFGRHRWFLG